MPAPLAEDIVDEAPPEPAIEHAAVIGRQEIVDSKRRVIGYELFNRSRAGAHTATSDASMLFTVLSHGGAQAAVGGKTVFINCSHDTLKSGLLDVIQPEGVVLEVPAVAGHVPLDIEAASCKLADLRKKGFRLSFNHSALTSPYGSWLPLASYIKLDLEAVPSEHLELLVRRAERFPQAKLIADKVTSIELYERLSRLGVHLFEGYWFSQPCLVKASMIRPAQATVVKLINLVRGDADLSEIEGVLKKDPSLSFNLLRFINSSGFGLSCEVTSFRHAAMILGQKKLFRWAVLLLTTSRESAAPPAVGSMAIVRGRLMELLAEAEMLPPEDRDNAFVVGVFSMLDTMLGITMEEALTAVSLPEPVVEALLHRGGEFAPFLNLTIACERGEDHEFARAANALQLSNQQINWSHLQALAWADAIAS